MLIFFLPTNEKYHLVCLISNIQNDHESIKAEPKQFRIILQLR